MAELLALIGIFGRAFSKCIMYSIDKDELRTVLYSEYIVPANLVDWGSDFFPALSLRLIFALSTAIF